MSRSPFGWSYPPGVNESDLPGNSREDQQHEAMTDALYEMLEKHSLGPEVPAALVESLIEFISKIYARGYAAGQSDAEEAHRTENPHS